MAVRDSSKMRITPCKLWKAIVCTLIILWFCFSIFHVTHLRRSENYPVEALQPRDNNSCGERLAASSTGDADPPTTASTTSWTPAAVADAELKPQQRLQMLEQLGEWRAEATSHCAAAVTALPVAGFARLHRVLFEPGMASGRLGGEDIFEVLNQPEASEYWELKLGAFSVLCPNASHRSRGALAGVLGDGVRFPKSHQMIRQYLAATVAIQDREEFAKLRDSAETLAGPVLAVTRHEYANLYHMIALMYNAFANSVFYGFDPAKATVLLVDGHPRGTLDPVWTTLFRRVVRIGQLTRRQALDDLVWVAEGHKSPVLADRPSLPLIEQFREFILTQHGLAPRPLATRNCTGSKVVLIWRRDYVAHPRNPRGRVVRQILNEADVMAEARRTFPHLKLNVTGVAMETLTFREQLNLISDTRLLIGMHGAGLSHAMFLPKWSGLVEIFPDFWSQENFHFRNIAAWRGLAYEQWTSGRSNGDTPITIPSGVIPELMQTALRKLGCH